MRAAGYARISEDRDGQGLGVARQKADIEALAEREGFDLVAMLVDNDVSAYSGKKRPEWERLVEMVEAGEVDVVVAWASDRLTRHPRELEDLVELLERTKTRVVTVTSGDYDLTTPEGRATARIVGAIARQESERKSVRSRRKHEELAMAGKDAGGGTRPFGYEPDRRTIREDEAALIVDAAQHVVAGRTLRGIADEWNRRGVETVTGVPWSTPVIRRILTAGRVAGVREHLGEVVAEAEWPAILDRATWERVRVLLSDPRRRTNTRKRKYLLTGGIARCGLCEAPLIARPKAPLHPGEDSRRCYVCARESRPPGCGKIRILAEDFEAYVAEAIAIAVAGGLPVLDVPDVDMAGIVEELAEARQSLEELAGDYYERRLIGRSEFFAARSGLQARVDELERERDAAALSGGGAALPSGDFSEAWEAADGDRRRAIVSAVADRVLVGPAVRGRNFFDPDRITIVWRA